MPRIELEQLISGFANITTEQLNLFRWFYQTFDNRMAANRTIVNVEPLYFQGASAGTEFLTYAATKLYLCMEIQSTIYTLLASSNIITLYNEANAVFYISTNLMPYWDTTAAIVKMANNDTTLKNKYFSRLTAGTYISFNGYRITLV
jgi:hypothetical protein